MASQQRVLENQDKTRISLKQDTTLGLTLITLLMGYIVPQQEAVLNCLSQEETLISILQQRLPQSFRQTEAVGLLLRPLQFAQFRKSLSTVQPAKSAGQCTEVRRGKAIALPPFHFKVSRERTVLYSPKSRTATVQRDGSSLYPHPSHVHVAPCRI